MMSNILQRAVGFPIMRCRKRTVLVFSPAVFHRSHDAALHHSPDRICRYHAPITRACCETRFDVNARFRFLALAWRTSGDAAAEEDEAAAHNKKAPDDAGAFLVSALPDQYLATIYPPNL
jgi:hypothetical protein